MASVGNVILGGVAAVLVWTCIGLAVARAVLPQRALVWPVAPAQARNGPVAAVPPVTAEIGPSVRKKVRMDFKTLELRRLTSMSPLKSPDATITPSAVLVQAIE